MSEQETQSTEASEISIAFPEAPELHLRIGVGACRLRIVPAKGDAWVQGTYRHPKGTLPPKIEERGGMVRVSQEFKMRDWRGVTPVPTFELALGKTRPYALTVETGASDSEIDLGGLPLSQLDIRQGAGRIAVGFSAPNPQEMGLLDLDAGAGAVEMKNLANANFAEMTVDGGAAGFKFDFSGNLRRDAQVKINTGVSGVDISIPSSTAAKVTTETTLGGVDVGDGFMKKEGAFRNEAALAGQTPVFTIRARVTVGGLSLRTTPKQPDHGAPLLP